MSRFISVFFFVFAFSANAHDCTKSLRALLAQANLKIETAREDGRLLPATFYDFKADQEAEKTWKGILPPPLLQKMLPDGIRLIDHPLLGATEAGVVKDAGSGEFLSLRLEAGGLGTNIGVSRSAIIQNLSRPNKSFVRDSSKAVIVFMHGGGTRTTGHHVALSLMNHFSPLGVDVISFDQAWHGEGPRKIFASPKDYFEWVRAVIQKTTAGSNKPVFLAGHSMGGEFADVYMRLYPHDDLVKGVIALSPVPDLAPGKSLKEKVELNERRDAESRSADTRSPEDRELHQGLVKQGKVSFTAMLFETLFSLQNSWVVPTDGGKSFVPALYVWGAKDWLYVGAEDLVESHLKTLPHLKLQIYGKRFDLVLNREVDVGHMIFDHHRPGTDRIETFADIQDFIEQTIGSKLETKKSQSQNDDLLRKMVQTYANNLAFREFTAHQIIRRKVVNEEMMKAINAKVKEINSRGNPPELEQERQRILNLRQGFHVPEGVDGDLGRQWVDQLKTLRAEDKEMNARREKLRAGLEEIRGKIRANQAAIDEGLQKITSEDLRANESEADRILSEMFALNEKIESSINQFYLRLEKQGKLNSESVEPTHDIQAFIREYEILFESYQAVLKKREEIVAAAALEGKLGLSLRALYVERSGAGSLTWREQTMARELEELEKKILEYEDLQQQLVVQLTEKYSEGLFRYQEVNLADIFNSDGSSLDQYRSYLQDAWSRWQILWRERPPAAKVSLY